MNYEEFRESGHRLVDLISDYLTNVQRRPLFPDVAPSQIHNLFDEPLPTSGNNLKSLEQRLKAELIPYSTHVNHRGYMGLITPSPNPAGILADLVASSLNQNLGVYSISPSATAMELRVLRWLNDLVGYAESAGGNLTSGGMTANFIGLKLARDLTTGNKAQYEGLQGQWAIYTSEERHLSIDKAVDAIGLGRNNLRAIPTNESYEVIPEAMEEAIALDKKKGIRPLCIIGLAGTTNLGAVDNLKALHALARHERCWFHVDAAYGGGMLLSKKYPGVLQDLHLADSITIDPHKWFYAPLECGAILVRDHQQLTDSFLIQHAYLKDQSEQRSERYNFFEHGFEQSRRFRGLKVWMSFKHYGTDQIGEWIDRNIDQAKHLHELVRGGSDFESAVEPRMSAICIRYKAEGLTEGQLTKLHHEVASRIEKEGRFWFATTVLKGKTWFRINPVNLYTEKETMNELYGALQQFCREAEAAEQPH